MKFSFILLSAFFPLLSCTSLNVQKKPVTSTPLASSRYPSSGGPVCIELFTKTPIYNKLAIEFLGNYNFPGQQLSKQFRLREATESVLGTLVDKSLFFNHSLNESFVFSLTLALHYGKGADFIAYLINHGNNAMIDILSESDFKKFKNMSLKDQIELGNNLLSEWQAKEGMQLQLANQKHEQILKSAARALALDFRNIEKSAPPGFQFIQMINKAGVTSREFNTVDWALSPSFVAMETFLKIILTRSDSSRVIEILIEAHKSILDANHIPSTDQTAIQALKDIDAHPVVQGQNNQIKFEDLVNFGLHSQHLLLEKTYNVLYERLSKK